MEGERFQPKESTEMTRREFVSTLVKVGVATFLAGSALGKIDGRFDGTEAQREYDRDPDGIYTERVASELSPEKVKQLDRVIDESLGDLSRVETFMTDLKRDLTVAGLSEEESEKAIRGYANYASKRMKSRLMGFADTLYTPPKDLGGGVR